MSDSVKTKIEISVFEDGTMRVQSSDAPKEFSFYARDAKHLHEVANWVWYKLKQLSRRLEK